MIISELWRHYEADKRIQGFSPKGFIRFIDICIKYGFCEEVVKEKLINRYS